jgi:hypothetical protein
LTKDNLLTLYRFYGARHSHINIGYKLDFEAIKSAKSTISMLRNVLHLGDKWMNQRERYFIWQSFIKLLFKHLRDVEELDSFYFDLIEDMNQKFEKQNPTRVAIESYVKLLKFEGRLHDDFRCLICEDEVINNMIITRGFLPAHKECIFSKTIDRDKVEDLFIMHSTIGLDDKDVEILWSVLLEGI